MISLLVIIFLVLCVRAFIDGYTGKIPNGYKERIDKARGQDEQNELNEINKQERINIIDNALVQYHKLLDSLAYQLRNETNEKKRSILLRQQIVTLEKLNRLLEKREKLD